MALIGVVISINSTSLHGQNEELALDYFNSGEFEKALALYISLHEQTPSEWINLEGAAYCLLKLGRLQEAQARGQGGVEKQTFIVHSIEKAGRKIA